MAAGEQKTPVAQIKKKIKKNYAKSKLYRGRSGN